jgi:2-iminobutanoate/2-iminopropanoate deaminase
MLKEIVTDRAPRPIGPYSQAVIGEGRRLLFTAGQIALDVDTGNIVSGGIEEQTRRVLDNLRAVIEEAGGKMEGVIKTTIFLAHMSDFPQVNAVYETYFRKPPYPARSTVEVAALPRGALVEVDAVVVLPE